jgi:hypothetical protein
MSGFLQAKRLASTYQFKQEDVSAVALQMAILADTSAKPTIG